MKHKITTIALAITLGIAVGGCSKENSTPPQTPSVVYYYNGQQHTAQLYNDEDWALLLDHLFALTEEGYTVQFFNPNVRPSADASKSREVFTTYNKQEAEDWCNQKENEGYTVTIKYDKETGLYTCIATK